MRNNKPLVADQRSYLVRTVSDAKSIGKAWLEQVQLAQVLAFGLPEVDDRYHFWRVPLKPKSRNGAIGEIVIDAFSAEVIFDRTTRPEILEARLLRKTNDDESTSRVREYVISPLRNTVGLGDCTQLLDDMPSESVDLVFTSPPYFNARPQYTEYEEY